jgi:hypothetical protein
MRSCGTGSRSRSREAPAPIKACPWCGEDFGVDSFRCTPSDVAPQNMEIGCANSLCPFGSGKPLQDLFALAHARLSCLGPDARLRRAAA